MRRLNLVNRYLLEIEQALQRLYERIQVPFLRVNLLLERVCVPERRVHVYPLHLHQI